MDSRRYAPYRRAPEVLQGPEAQRVFPEQRRLVGAHSGDLLLRRGPVFGEDVEEIGQSAAFLLRQLTAVGLLWYWLAARSRGRSWRLPLPVRGGR